MSVNDYSRCNVEKLSAKNDCDKIFRVNPTQHKQLLFGVWCSQQPGGSPGTKSHFSQIGILSMFGDVGQSQFFVLFCFMQLFDLTHPESPRGTPQS